MLRGVAIDPFPYGLGSIVVAFYRQFASRCCRYRRLGGLKVANACSRAVLVLLFLRENFVVAAADDCADGGVVVVVDDGTDSAFVVYLCSPSCRYYACWQRERQMEIITCC
jgi:hypothetical protein